MSNPAPFESIAGLLERSLSIRHVYGEPVQNGDTTVIPVAQVVYGFGAGGGRGPGRRLTRAAVDRAAEEQGPDDEKGQHRAEGSGGGGGVRLTPVGALEIGPMGTRFVHFRPLAPLAAAIGCGLAIGWLIGRRRG